MLHARCKADARKSLNDATSTLVDEVKVHVASDGHSLKAVDPEHAAMGEMTVRAAARQSGSARCGAERLAWRAGGV